LGSDTAVNSLDKEAVVAGPGIHESGLMVYQTGVGWSEQVESGLRRTACVASAQGTALLEERLDVLRVAHVRVRENDRIGIGIGDLIFAGRDDQQKRDRINGMLDALIHFLHCDLPDPGY